MKDRRSTELCENYNEVVPDASSRVKGETIMLVVMKSQSTSDEIEAVLDSIRKMGLTPHPMPGATRTAIGITGNTGAVDPRTIEVLPGVHELLRVTKPFKLASREMRAHDTVVRMTQGHVRRRPVHDHRRPVLRRGRGDDPAHRRVADGPRHPLPARRGIQAAHQPLRFSGAGARGPRDPAPAREKTGIAIVTELMDTENADAVEAVADVIQIGARNMQNFSSAAGGSRRRLSRCSSNAGCRPRSRNG